MLERAPRREDEPEVVVETPVRAVHRLQPERSRGRDDASEGVLRAAGSDRQDGDTERSGHVGRAEDERLEPVAGGGDPLGLDEPARRLDLSLEADSVRQQLGRSGHVLGGLDLGEYDHVGARLCGRAQVVLPPRRRARVDAKRGRSAERAAPQRGDSELTRLLLVFGSDRVLEVDHDLVGGERRRLREHPLARGGNGEAGAAGAGGHARRLTGRLLPDRDVLRALGGERRAVPVRPPLAQRHAARGAP